jgi:hypothetical protein
MRRFDLFAVITLLVGGVVVPVLGWFVGAGMILASRRWRPWQKLLGLVVWPGGLLVPVSMAITSRPSGCLTMARLFTSGGPTIPAGGSTFIVVSCDEPGPVWHGFPLIAPVLAITSILVGAYLLRASHRATRAAAAA